MNKEFEIAVVGGGIAGLTAGLTAARLGRSTIVITGDTLGGHLLSIERIEGFPGYAEGVAGYDLCPITQGQAGEAGAEFAMSMVSRVEADGDRWRLETSSGEYTASALIITSGTSLKELRVPGEESLRGKGVSHCASCDAPLLGGRKVVVAGGGDSAMQEALTLAEHAAEVVVVHHGDALAGQASFVERVSSNPKISLRANSEIGEILGGEAVTGVRIRNGAGTADLETDGVFVYIGLEPNTAFLAGVVDLSPDGHVIAEGFKASKPGAFAAGTVRAGAAGRAAAAAGEGSGAALAADEYLRSGAGL